MVAREPIRFDIERRGEDSGASLDYYHPSTNSCPSDNSETNDRFSLAYLDACFNSISGLQDNFKSFAILLTSLTRTYLIDPFQKFQTSDKMKFLEERGTYFLDQKSRSPSL